MKIALSIPDDLFESGETLSKRLGVSRSRLYATALAEFVALITRMNRGRAFYATPEHLGEYVLVDFVTGRTRGVG